MEGVRLRKTLCLIVGQVTKALLLSDEGVYRFIRGYHNDFSLISCSSACYWWVCYCFPFRSLARSAKLLSVGALLVAYEFKFGQAKVDDVGIAHVGSQGYIMDDDPGDEEPQMQSELFGLWLAGECYEP